MDQLAILALASFSCLEAEPVEFKPFRRVGSPELNDLEAAASEYENPHASIEAGSKHFQDIYVAMENPNELQFGHVAENPTNWEQRFEKINLDNLQRQGKVRWGDKNGDYGEHYWDLNHAGNEEEEKKQEEDQETKKKPQYAVHEKEQQDDKPKYITYGLARQESIRRPAFASIDGNQRGKREQGLLKDVEFINDNARSLILDGNAQKHGGNYRSAEDYRGKREQHIVNEEDLVFESDKGTFLDRKTGIEYELKPIYP